MWNPSGPRDDVLETGVKEAFRTYEFSHASSSLSADILPGSAWKRPPVSGGRFRSRCWLAGELGLVGLHRPETLFYLDPFYHGSEDNHGDELFGSEQFTLMAARLRNLKGRFILSINDVPEIRERRSRGFGWRGSSFPIPSAAGKVGPRES